MFFILKLSYDNNDLLVHAIEMFNMVLLLKLKL